MTKHPQAPVQELPPDYDFLPDDVPLVGREAYLPGAHLQRLSRLGDLAAKNAAYLEENFPDTSIDPREHRPVKAFLMQLARGKRPYSIGRWKQLRDFLDTNEVSGAPLQQQVAEQRRLGDAFYEQWFRFYEEEWRGLSQLRHDMHGRQFDPQKSQALSAYMDAILTPELKKEVSRWLDADEASEPRSEQKDRQNTDHFDGEEYADWFMWGASDDDLREVVKLHYERIKRFNQSPQAVEQIAANKERLMKLVEKAVAADKLPETAVDAFRHSLDRTKIYVGDEFSTVFRGISGFYDREEDYLVLEPGYPFSTFVHEVIHASGQAYDQVIDEAVAEHITNILLDQHPFESPGHQEAGMHGTYSEYRELLDVIANEGVPKIGIKRIIQAFFDRDKRAYAKFDSDILSSFSYLDTFVSPRADGWVSSKHFIANLLTPLQESFVSAHLSSKKEDMAAFQKDVLMSAFALRIACAVARNESNVKQIINKAREVLARRPDHSPSDIETLISISESLRAKRTEPILQAV